MTSNQKQRLQKVLADAGIASRRNCEQLILSGRVEVDRKVVTVLGTKVDAESQDIRVDGEQIHTVRHVYYMVNKPKGVLSTSRDPAGRPRVIDLIPESAGRVFTVGRLDMESEGLILLTNDGPLANRLAHPRYGVSKKYHVQVAGFPTKQLLDRLRGGIRVAESRLRAKSVCVRRRHKQSTILEIVLQEGKNREIRRMLAAVGHRVQLLRRVAIGPISLGRLPEGQSRLLSTSQVRDLKKAAGQLRHSNKGSDKR